MSWKHLRRLFHFDGNLGGLHYEARLAVFELNALDGFSVGNEISAAQRKRLPGTTDGSIAFQLQVWETEGGASSPQVNPRSQPSGGSSRP